MARQCLPLTLVPRLGLDRRQGSKACLLESFAAGEMLVAWFNLVGVMESGRRKGGKEEGSAADIAVGRRY